MKVDSKIILRENISISEVYSVIKESEYWIIEKKLERSRTKTRSKYRLCEKYDPHTIQTI